MDNKKLLIIAAVALIISLLMITPDRSGIHCARGYIPIDGTCVNFNRW